MAIRRRVKQVLSICDRLASFAKDMRDHASRLQPGAKQDALLEKARQADAAVHLDNWANSHDLQPPKQPSLAATNAKRSPKRPPQKRGGRFRPPLYLVLQKQMRSY